MNQGLLLAAIAVAAAIILLLQAPRDPFRIGAVVVAGVQVLIVLGIIRLSVSGLSLGLVFGAALTALGVVLWLKAPAKTAISAATALTLVGALKLLSALHLNL
ncbi:MAG: hypothetical protein ACYC8T_00695 [Myxococcaceae bacterium]